MIDTLAEKIRTQSYSIVTHCDDMMNSSRDDVNLKELKTALKNLKDSHYHIAQYIEEIEDHIYDGKL